MKTNKNITTIITIKEKSNFERCFLSTKKLNCDYLVLDSFNLEDVKLFCEIHKIKYINFYKKTKNYDEMKNKAIEESDSEWLFFIDSNETIISGIDKFSVIENEKAFSVCVMNQYTITKELRLFRKSSNYKFLNSYYESVIANSKLLDVYIHSTDVLDQQKALIYFLEQETMFPSKNSIRYYLACCFLACNRLTEFSNKAEEFLFHSKKNDMAQIMINYYLSMVRCVKKSNLESAIKYISICILYKPDMSEFWCCLADIFYQLNDIKKAKCFYKIAIIAGSKRKKTDLWPLEIKKYKEYPKKMIENCDDIEKQKKSYIKI